MVTKPGRVVAGHDVAARAPRPPEPLPATSTPGTTAWAWAAGGGVCGLAWTGALRAYMVELAGHESVFTWGGTFGALLVPGALTGGLLGWAEYRRRTGRRRGQAWLILAPLPFVVAPMLLPGALRQLVTSGLGGGAIAVAAMGVVGGFALSGRGRRWARVLCGTVGVAFAVALAGTVAGLSGQSLTEPRAAWAAVLAAALFAVLALGCSIPFRDGGSAAHTQKAEVTP